jgi:cytochrome c biogenesis protein CcdA/thiol-disulfide isomerase/thioredoxin
MLILMSFAFIAGIVTVLSPCILPILPVVLAGSVDGGKARPLGVITGFIVSFTTFTLTLSTIVQALHINPDILRTAAASLIFIFGIILVIPFLKDRFMRFVSRLTARTTVSKSTGTAKRGFWSGVVLGTSLGLVWTPCVGPIMVSVITLALSNNITAGSVMITLSYSLGTSLPFFLIMQGGSAILTRFPFFLKHTMGIQRTFGALMVVTSLVLFTGTDRIFQTWILGTFPRYGAGLASIDNRDVVRKELDSRMPVRELSSDDPLALGSGVWINSGQLSLAELKGKVVLVDIWTYSCINCLRTIPYLQSWYNTYKDKGLVIVGVHSPEFAFERSESNLRKAVTDLGVTWPVVQDNDFRIWRYYNNRYWPAHYLYAKDGTLVESHYGEGGYAETEMKIQMLLGISAPVVSKNIASAANSDISPETYLGYDRGERFASPERIVRDDVSFYSIPRDFAADYWALSGRWAIGKEYSESKAGSALSFSFHAGKVYLVINPVQGESKKLRVFMDGKSYTSGEVRNGILTLDGNRLYQLYNSEKPVKGILRIEFDGRVRIFAFTFG